MPKHTICIDAWNQAGIDEAAFTIRNACGGGERNDATLKVAIIRRSTGFKAGQSADGGLGIEREVSQTLNAHMSALEPTMYSYKRIIGCDGYNAKLTGQVTMTVTGQRICHKHIPTVVAFAQNTRDEVRKVNGDGKIAGALAANPGMKQTNYIMTLKDSKRTTTSGIDCLTPSHPQTHRVYSPDGAWPSICANLGVAGQNQQAVFKNNDNTKKGNTEMTAEVRRLTPLECERLMGFPDDYTAVMGAESARYSACGNSWAANCARNVIKGIHKADEKIEGKCRAFKYGTISSGVECHTISADGLGDKPVFYSEISPSPVSLLQAHYPSVPILGDMTLVDIDAEKGVVHNRPYDGYKEPDEQAMGFKPFKTPEPVEIPCKYGEIDLVSGGTPCQSFSVAGKRDGGAEGSGTRSALAFQLPRIGKAVGARWLLWENVPGAFSSAGGKDFAWFVYRVMEAGYSLAWRTLDAQYVRSDTHPRAVPQRRRRIWLVAYRGNDWRVPCEALFEPMKALGTEPPMRTVGVGYLEKDEVRSAKCEQRSDNSAVGTSHLDLGTSSPDDELFEFNEFMKGTKESIIKILVDKGICQSPEARRKELSAAKNTVDMAQDDLFGGDLFGPVEPHHQGRGLKAKDLELNLPDEPTIASVGLANLYEWAKSVSSEVCYCGSLFKRSAKDGESAKCEVRTNHTVDDLDPKMLSNLGNAGFLSNGVICTMKMPEWNAGITEEALATMPRELAELYDGDVCGLSDILEDNPDVKYKLSWRACYGILNRAVKRGKMLPVELAYALVERIVDQAPIVKWYAMNGRDVVKKEGQLTERAIAKIAFDDYIEAEWHWVDVKEELPKKGVEEIEADSVIDELTDEIYEKFVDECDDESEGGEVE